MLSESEMNKGRALPMWSTLTVLVLACGLLLAGGMPLVGDPEIYRSPFMLFLGVVAAMLCLWGGWRIAKGQRAQFIFGLVSTFFAVAGLIVLCRYGARAVSYAWLGGVMWFGALGMACTAVVGGLFTAIFGFFVYKLMKRHLWLAGLHWSLLLVGIGAYLDYCGERMAFVPLPANGQTCAETVVTSEGENIKLPFKLYVESFTTTYYGEDSYSIYHQEGEEWVLDGHPELQVDSLRYGDELWALEDLKISSAMPQPFLLLPGEPNRLIMRDARPVKTYSASCRIETEHRGRPEVRHHELQVNSPIECKEWLIYLNSYTPMGNNTLVTLQLRSAPGRLIALVGMVGLIISTVFWCWWRKEKPADEPQPVIDPAVLYPERASRLWDVSEQPVAEPATAPKDEAENGKEKEEV